MDVVGSLALVSPIAAFFYGRIRAKGCPSWPGLWRVIIVMICSAYLLVLPYLHYRRDVYFATLPGWELFAVFSLQIVGRLAPVFAVVFILNANDIAEVERGKVCRNCCYNLTGNVSGICPECGTKINQCD